MSVDVHGFGLISPIALDPAQHAAFLAAGLGVNPPSAFVRGDEPLPIRHAPWLAATAPIATRLLDLASRAIITALSVRAPRLEPLRAIVVTSRPRLGLEATDLDALLAALVERHPLRIVGRHHGAAGAFAAIEEATLAVEDGAKEALVLGVDSFIALETIRDLAPAMTSAWIADPAPPSEGAAALLLGRGEHPLARIHWSGAELGAGTDEDDAIVDGAAMTKLLRASPNRGPIRRAYGQARVDRLRLNEWTFAVARTSERFDPAYEERSLEDATGALGAAAGVANLVYAIARERLEPEHAALVAWAISEDGTRGLAALEVSR